MTYCVDQHHPLADDRGPGDPARPRRTISTAAQRLQPGDEVVIRRGIYRERITPARGGTEGRPIVYRAEAGHDVIVRGSVPIAPPPERHDGIACVAIPFSRGHNPFRVLAKRVPVRQVLGQLFLNGEPLQQTHDEQILQSVALTWLAAEDGRTVWVHLEGSAGVLEATRHERLFAPRLRGLGYIHIIGIVFEHCSNPLPSAFWLDRETERGGTPQAGVVSTRSGHHWRIERCTIRHATGIGIDFGSEGGRDIDPLPSGPQAAPAIEVVGYHTICDNHLYDLGVCGIAGYRSTGVVVAHNRIERCNTLGWGAPECAGVKVHYFINGRIEANLVRDCDCHGIWLDNVWTNARVTRNVVLNCCQAGIFVEMGYGPCSVDHNIVGMTRTGDGIYTHDASGVEVAHNLLIGNSHFGIYMRTVTDRKVERSPDEWRPVETSDQRIVANMLVDNYRGAICLPPQTPTTRNNQCDRNLYVGGTQWQWESARTPWFMLTNCDGRLAVESFDGRPMPGQALSLDQWREATGNDRHSRAIVAQRGAVDEGAMEPGQFRLCSRGNYIECVRVEAFATHDGLAPGPLDLRGTGVKRWLLWPIPREAEMKRAV